MQQELLNWISKQQQHLDEIIVKTADAYLENNRNSRSNFIFDIQESNQEKYALSKGKDLCYDRPSVGFVYSLWYHGRRVNTFLNYLIKCFSENTEQQIDIFDLGAGTGAVQWAIGLIYAGMKFLNITAPQMKIINIDNSPFMLQYHQLLWQQFISHYNECSDIIWEYKINSWNNSHDSDNTNAWICASYLFDSSENQEAIANDFIALIQNYKPSNLILLTSDQPEKRKYLENLSINLNLCGYRVEEKCLKNELFDGVMSSVSQRRDKYRIEFNIKGLTGKALWNDHSFTGKVFRREIIQQLTLLDIFDDKQSIQSIDIYNPPSKQRKQIELSENQKKAAKHSDRPAIITGAAGSGKSIVITERIKNLVEENNYNPSLRILLTTFNKGLVGQLGDWLQEILDSNKYRRIVDSNNQGEREETSKFYFDNLSSSPNINLMHFDVLPTRIGGILGGKTPYSKFIPEKIDKIIQEVRQQHNLRDNEYDDVINIEFILDEFHRVFYGLDYRTKEIYLTSTRYGRGNKPKLQKIKRAIVWDCLERFYNFLEEKDIHEYTRIRIKFLDRLKASQEKRLFTHIFVDEFQDCTPADFEIFYQLLQQPDNLVIGGDSAQSVRLGTSCSGLTRKADMAKREFFRLESSYRLPYRISECIRELSKRIIYKHRNPNRNPDISPNEITPYKGSPPGARPIVVFAKTVDLISQKIKEIFETYQDAYNLKKITILEKDSSLCYALKKLKINSETDTVLRIKGLEKECVLWSVRKRIENENEAEEIVYTILTRTSSILIIRPVRKFTSESVQSFESQL